MRRVRIFYFTCLLLFSILYVFAADSKKEKITLTKKNATWLLLFEEIEKQSGYIFSFNPSLLNGMDEISFEAKNEPLTRVLDRLFESTPITYSIVKKYIILKQKDKTVQIRGYIINREGTEKLSGATIIDKKNNRGTVSISDGSFWLDLSPGEVQLEFSYIGYKRYYQTIPFLTKDTVLYIALEESTKLKDIVVMGDEKSPVQITSSQPGAYLLGKETFERIPVVMGEADVIKTIQNLPGVSSGIDGLADMYVRGGIGDDNLFMVDGVPLYEVNHLGGLFSPFNVQMIENVSFYKAGFPAKYGSRLSSVVDICFKEGDPKKYHGTAMIGLTSGSLQLEGPLVKDKTTFNIGMRRSWLEVLSVPALAILNKARESEQGNLQGRYAFHDFNFKLTHLLTSKDKLYVNGYWSSDFLKGGRETEQSPDDILFQTKDRVRLRWGNLMVAGGWQHQFGTKLNSDLKVAYTSYSSTLKREYDELLDADSEQQKAGIRQDNHNGIKDFNIRNEFLLDASDKHLFKFGGHYTYHKYAPEASSRYYGDDLKKSYEQDDETEGHEINVYAEDRWTVGEIFQFFGGMHFSHYRVKEKSWTSIEPRVSAIVSPDKNIELQFSYSRMSQYIHQLSETHISLPTDMWLPSSSYFKPQVSDQFSVGVKYKPAQMYEFLVEGYFKKMDNILDIKDGAFSLPSSYGWQDKLTAGCGRSYGLEMLVQKNIGRVTGWLGYRLMWADRKFEEIDKGKWFPAKFDNRHTVNVVANYKLRKNVELTGTWQFKTGNRVTLALDSYKDMEQVGLGHIDDYYIYDFSQPGYIEGRNNIRLPAYHRLDLGINFYRPKSKGRMGIWNISIYNVYSRLNAMAIERREWLTNIYPGDGQIRKRVEFRTVGLLPIIPSVSYTYKF